MRLNRTPLSLLLLSLTFLGLTACGSGDSDETSPLLEVNPFNQDLRTQELTLSGQIELGAEIEIDVSTSSGGATSGNVEIFGPENGIWSAWITELAEGDTWVNITATDDTGNMTQTRFGVQVTLVPGVESVTYSAEPRGFEVRFFEAVDWETVDKKENFYIVNESDNSTLVGTITPQNDGYAFRFVPDSELAGNQFYSVFLTTGITDVEGNALDLGEDDTGEDRPGQFWRIYIPENQ